MTKTSKQLKAELEEIWNRPGVLNECHINYFFDQFGQTLTAKAGRLVSDPMIKADAKLTRKRIKAFEDWKAREARLADILSRNELELNAYKSSFVAAECQKIAA